MQGTLVLHVPPGRTVYHGPGAAAADQARRRRHDQRQHQRRHARRRAERRPHAQAQEGAPQPAGPQRPRVPVLA